jgi:hypothetical protein
MMPTLNVVLGETGTGVRVKRSIIRASATIGLATPKSLQATDGNFVAPAAQSLGDDRIGARAVDNNQRRDRRRPTRLLIDVTHAAQIAFTLFADVADEQQRRSVHQFHRLQGPGNR